MAGVLGDRKATRSSRWRPAAWRARTRRSTRSSNWRYGYRRSPCTTAIRSGNTDALRRRKLSGVSSVRYALMTSGWYRPDRTGHDRHLPARESPGPFQFVRHEEDGAPLACAAPQQAVEQVPAGGVEAGVGLVEQQQ